MKPEVCTTQTLIREAMVFACSVIRATVLDAGIQPLDCIVSTHY